jgi:outer membrane protein OmpA-like peptidoglycan-associated protein
MKSKLMGAVAALLALGAAGQAAAQVTRSPILDRGSPGAMRGEIEQRYEAALAATLSRDVVFANDVRYTWASEAKVACGIAIGFLKTNTVDEDSINKCDYYSRRMAEPAGPIMMAAAPPPPAPVAAAPCSVQLPIVFYFEWNVDAPPADAAAVAATAAQQMQACGWRNLRIAGHADTSGSSKYNEGLSERRARNVAGLLQNAGVAGETLAVEAFGETRPAVQTPDGVREPLNRRVEVTTAAAQ